MILAATEVELSSCFQYVTDRQPIEKNFLAFEGNIGDRRTILAVTGVGKSNAAMVTYALLDKYPTDLTIMMGCAGAFPAAEIQLGDVVIADREIFVDEGALTPSGFLDMQTIGLPLAEEASGKKLFNEIPVRYPPSEIVDLGSGLDFNIIMGPIATTSTCSGTPEQAAWIYEHWKPMAEVMEGAAAALAAMRLGCPLLEIRGISNVAGTRARGSWKIDTACNHAALVISRLLALDTTAWPSNPDEAREDRG